MPIPSESALLHPDELVKRLDQTNLVIFDCSFELARPEHWAQNFALQHIPGAFYAHLNQDLSTTVTDQTGQHPLPDREDFCRFLRAHGVNADSLVVAYDQVQGDFAARLWWMLRWLGHTNVKLLEGGLDFWISREHPLNHQLKQPVVGNIEVKPSLVRLVKIEEVEKMAREKTGCLVDSRAPERYRGLVEPLYAKKGHIPSALNRYYRNNLAPNNHFKPKDQLQAEFSALLGQNSPSEAVFYCGSGVTACHNVLAAHEIGCKVGLFEGSFSHWIKDPKHAVETNL